MVIPKPFHHSCSMPDKHWSEKDWGYQKLTRYKNNCMQQNNIEFLDVAKHHILRLHVGGHDRQILNEASAQRYIEHDCTLSVVTHSQNLAGTLSSLRESGYTRQYCQWNDFVILEACGSAKQNFLRSLHVCYNHSHAHSKHTATQKVMEVYRPHTPDAVCNITTSEHEAIIIVFCQQTYFVDF